MYWSRTLAILFAGSLLLTPFAHADKGDYVLGGGAETDSADNRAFSAFADVAVSENTWLTGAMARNIVELGRGLESRTWYGNLGVDHYFDPAGVRFGVAYWGDNEILDSVDLRASLYTRGARGSLSIDFDHRDFEFDLPPLDALPQTNIPFHATGFGLSGRLKLSERVDVYLAGLRYDYNVEFNRPDTGRLAQQISIGRLSLLSSLIDWDARSGVGVNFGLRRLQLDVARWRSSLDDGDNTSVSVSFLTPMTDRTDIELSLGYDDSELYGDVTIASIYIYFYGGG